MKKLILAALFASWLSPTQAADNVIKVSANKKTVVYHHMVYNTSTCLGGPLPVMKIITPPQSGEVTFAKTTNKLGSNNGKCSGKTVKGTSVFYKPKKGFRGRDNFKVGYVFMTNEYTGTVRSIQETYTVDVK